MIEFISSWAQRIIIAVIIASIFEMILPNGNNKKYIKVVIGIYILFNIISPITDKLFGSASSLSSTNLSKYFDLDSLNGNVNNINNINEKINNSNEENIKNLYISKLKSDLKNKLKDMNYIISNIEIILDNSDEYNVDKISFRIDKNDNKRNDTKNNIDIKPIEEINISITNEINETNEDNKNIKSNVTNDEKDKIKKFINDTYNIKLQNIFIN